ncbi:MAG: PD-(D/E)XK nuclease family protein [Gammaproteobacteria bacterium]|nr:PD-(D/E)XK nuclease family protein [Gammaproteobacteria bacterium]
MQNTLYDKLNNKAIALTPNRRFARFLEKKYGEHKIEQGYKTWETPSIFPAETWLQNSYLDGEHDKILLNNEQAHFIWKEITREHPNLTQIAEQAWQIICSWNLNPLTWDSTYLNDDHKILIDWIKEYQTICTKDNWLDPALLAYELTNNTPENLYQKKPEIMLIGFEDIPPDLQKLLTKLQQLGTTLINHKLDRPKANSIHLYNFTTLDKEIAAMASWAKKTIDENRGTTNIGCVVPNLAELKNEINYCFEIICSDLFDITIGKELNNYQTIDTALNILKLLSQTLTLDEAKRLLLSPNIKGATEEISARALLHKHLRSIKTTSVTLRELLALSKNSEAKWFTPILAQILDDTQLLIKQTPAYQSNKMWVELLNKALDLFAWPNNDGEDEQHAQITQSWCEALKQLLSLDLFNKPQNLKQTIYNLNNILKKRTLHLKNNNTQPIKILGVLEAANLTFDHLWIMNMHNQNWPARPKPNPLIPLHIQKKHNLPHATYARELLYAEKLTDRLLHTSNEVIFSFSKQNGDVEYQASPLLMQIHGIKEELYLDPGFRRDDVGKKHNDKNNIETKETVTQQTTKLSPNEQITGGSRIYKLQAACPFRAFAECRLHATATEIADKYISAKERGIMIHTAIEYFWNTVRSQNKLLTSNSDTLNKVISDSIKNAISVLKKYHKYEPLDDEFLALEIKHLQYLIYKWLDVEKERPPFTVLSQEQDLSASLQNLKIKLRIDRIDQLEDGSIILIDYKTGNVSTSAWFGERPDDPQLPLYLLNSQREISGILFAEITPHNPKFSGLTAHDYKIPGVKIANNWQELITDWHKTLTSLSKEFENGIAKVEPKKGEQTCRNCHLQALCRIFSAT